MKKLALIAALAAITAAPAYAGEGFYAVGSLGWSQASIDKGEADNSLIAAGFTNPTSSTDESDIAYKAQLGYQFSDYFAIEGGYIDLGKVNYTASVTGGTASVDLKARGINLNAVGIYPINEQFSLFAKAGIIDARVKTTRVGTGTVGFTQPNDSNTSVRPTVGFGGTYKINESFGIRAEYEYFNKVGDENTTGSGDINLVSAGVVYKF